MGTLMLFVDGIGVGAADPESNPFAAIGARRLAPLAGGEPDPESSFVPLDTRLGVPGLPQSATNQTTMLTGVNAPDQIGEHRVGIPGPRLWPLLERESLFLKLEMAGKHATFANAYTREHLSAQRPRWSATTRAVMAAGLPFRFCDPDGLQGRALFHDYTGATARQRGVDAPELAAADAAGVLLGLLEEHEFVLYEYFLTDLVGHRGSFDDQMAQARRVETLVDALVGRLDAGRQRLILVSDHGNLEDCSHGRHTTNPVPWLVWGRDREASTEWMGSLIDVTPKLLTLLQA